MKDRDSAGYHGVRYLIDAKDRSREYAIRFNGGRPEKPFYAFSSAPHANMIMPHARPFKPNEIIFALDDDPDYKGDTLQVILYEITTDSASEPRRLKHTPVEYQLDQHGKYIMTPHSADRLREEGFHGDFPRTFPRNSMEITSATVARWSMIENAGKPVVKNAPSAEERLEVLEAKVGRLQAQMAKAVKPHKKSGQKRSARKKQPPKERFTV